MPRAPLVRVLAQVRFPCILKIDSKEAVARFQEEIRRDYPLLEQEVSQQFQIQMGPGGPAIREVPGKLWRFCDAEKKWRITLVTDSVSLETDFYLSREDFLARWTTVLATTAQG